MNLSFKIKHHFFRAFREFFVHNHNSLEFRAKLFALIIAVNEEINEDNYILVKKLSMNTYKNDEHRAEVLTLSTKEVVEKLRESKDINIDSLITSIQKELRKIPRYAKKIEVDKLREFLQYTYDKDTLDYQENILEFLEKLKAETLEKRKKHIEIDEETLESRY
jgi:UDP-N-acetyl-D-mannosaminuronate dehydrogenase